MRLGLRILLQLVIAALLLAAALPALHLATALLTPLLHYDDLHDATREPGVLVFFGLVYVVLCAGAVSLTRRLGGRTSEALGGVALFAALGAWAAWQSQVETQAVTALAPGLLFPVVIVVSCLGGWSLGAWLVRRRIHR